MAAEDIFCGAIEESGDEDEVCLLPKGHTGEHDYDDDGSEAVARSLELQRDPRTTDIHPSSRQQPEL